MGKRKKNITLSKAQKQFVSVLKSSDSKGPYHVEKILGYFHGFYLVKWVGYSRCTWEPKKNLTDCDKALKVFRATRPKMKDKSEFVGIMRPTLVPKRVVGEKIIYDLDENTSVYLICELEKFKGHEEALFKYEEMREHHPDIVRKYLKKSVVV